jgi:HEAT repeat protein
MRRLFWPALVLLASCGGPEANRTSSDPYERFLWTWEIYQAPDSTQMAELVALLEDPHYLVVSGALDAFGRIGRPEFLQHAVPKLKHPHPFVRASACSLIQHLRNPEGIPSLVEMLKDPEPSVRRQAVKSLATFGAKPEILRALAPVVGDKDPGVGFLAHQRLQELTGRINVPRTAKAWSEAYP